MADEKTTGRPISASSYNELFEAVTEMQEKLRLLETSTVSQSPTTMPNSTSSVDYRILPDVGTSIWSFTGHETSYQAEDWISSLDGLANIKPVATAISPVVCTFARN